MKAEDLIHEYITHMKVKDGEDFIPTKQDDFDTSIDLFDTLNDEEKRTVIITFMSHCLRYRLDKGRWEDIKTHKSLMLDTAKKVQNIYLDALDKTDDKKIRNYFAKKATDLWDDVRMKQEKTPTKDEIREYLKSIFGKEYSRKQKQLLDSI